MTPAGLLVKVSPTFRTRGVVTRMLEGWGFDTVDGDLVYLKEDPTPAFARFSLIESQVSAVLTIVELSRAQTDSYLRRRDGQGKEEDPQTP